jgi:hypothetical protein
MTGPMFGLISGSGVRPERHALNLAVLLGLGYVGGVRDERRYLNIAAQARRVASRSGWGRSLG